MGYDTKDDELIFDPSDEAPALAKPYDGDSVQEDFSDDDA